MKIENYNRYKLGALKRKFQTGRADMPPGTFIAKANEKKREALTKQQLPQNPTERTAILGAV